MWTRYLYERKRKIILKERSHVFKKQLDNWNLQKIFSRNQSWNNSHYIPHNVLVRLFRQGSITLYLLALHFLCFGASIYSFSGLENYYLPDEFKETRRVALHKKIFFCLFLLALCILVHPHAERRGQALEAQLILGLKCVNRSNRPSMIILIHARFSFMFTFGVIRPWTLHCILCRVHWKITFYDLVLSGVPESKALVRCPSLLTLRIFDFSETADRENFTMTWSKYIQCPLRSLCFFVPILESSCLRCPLIGRDFSTSSLQPLIWIWQNLIGSNNPMSFTKLVFLPIHQQRRIKMTALASEWLIHFRLIFNHWPELDETWQEANLKFPLLWLCFSVPKCTILGPLDKSVCYMLNSYRL